MLSPTETDDIRTAGSAGIRALQLSAHLWRVTRTDGVVLGHVQAVQRSDGIRYAAKLRLPGGSRSLFLGEFWQLSDAFDTFG